MTNKEAFAVVVGIDKPAGDIVYGTATDFACGRVVDI
jgi:hypothetical protein